MAHKAFVFEWTPFERELGRILYDALAIRQTTALATFIEGNINLLRDPDTGRSLAPDWSKAVVAADVQRYADVALTKFYGPRCDIGLGDDWEGVQDVLKPSEADAAMILGAPFGPRANYFDPGKMGAYFQSPEVVAEHLRILQGLAPKARSIDGVLDASLEMFQRANQTASGLYVTF